MKISFVGKNDFFDRFTLTDPEREAALEYLTDDGDEGVGASAEMSYSFAYGCLLFKLYSDEAGYYFWPAVPLSDECDIAAAYRAVAEYCKLEAIPELYVDIPAEDVEYITRGAPHAALHDVSDGAGETYAIEIFTECMLVCALPELMVDELYLGELVPCYDSEYERLVLDAEVNKYYGYSFRDDIPNGGGKEFREAAEAQLSSGEAMTFALTVYREEKNVFVGEASLYAFDGRGGAEMAFRLLPEWQGLGLGREALLGCIGIAEGLGLTRVSARVMEENLRSRRLLSRFAPICSVNNGVCVFEFSREKDGKFL
ncbi:MAG: GNAT family N-acetyltransferase [Clostridia bacterium]|nr:GNAT family N-acetyltransferase [Clostridia bacterium]